MFSKPEVLMQGEGWSLDLCDIIDPKITTKWFQHIKNLKLQTKPHTDRMWEGKQTRMRRDVEFYSLKPVSYILSKRSFPAVDFSVEQKEILECVNKERDEVYNSMIINKYQTGDDLISPHCDDADTLGKFGVCTISFGATRICRFRKKIDYNPDGVFGDIVLDVPCVHGSMLSMVGTFQTFFTHEIVYDPECIDVRFALTMRCMREELKPSSICVTCKTNPAAKNKKYCRSCTVKFQSTFRSC